MLNEVVIIE